MEAFDWNLELAVEDHYSRAQDSDSDPTYEQEPGQPAAPIAGGSNILGGSAASSRSVPSAAPATDSSKPQAKPASSSSKKFATLGDYGSSHAQDDSDSDEGQDMFAGGEKSALAVQNPDDLKKKIIEKAARHGKDIEEPQKKSNFVGSARTLGGEDTPSQEIPADPSAQPVERVRRILHFWSDGFSVDDGDLFRFDDARNAEMLHLIRSGRAPLHIMNVQPGQEVDVEVRPHEEAFKKPKPTYKPFDGSGQRLGSPTPGVSSTSNMPGAFVSSAPTPAPARSIAPPPPTNQVDDSKPTVTLRISLGTGTRLTSRFNTDQTIGDVYDFVQRAEPGGRQFVLQTTFPTKELSDKSLVLGEMPDFKRGGAVVQRYT